MTLRLPLYGNRHATIVSAYAPTMTNPDDVKDKFYNDLNSVISATPRTDKLILLGDFNASVGTDHQTWEGEIGTEGTGKCNSNVLLLLKKCAEHELLITNTVFRLPTRNKKTSWMHPRSKHWHLIDYVIVRRKDRQDVRVTKTLCGADCWTDHRLVVSKLNLRIQLARQPQGKKVAKRLDVSKLKQDNKRQAFINDICSRLDAMELRSDDADENWTVFRDTVHSSAIDSLGSVSRRHQDWFDENDEEIQGLLEEKHQNTMHTLGISASYPITRHIQKYARQYRLGSEILSTQSLMMAMLHSLIARRRFGPHTQWRSLRKTINSGLGLDDMFWLGRPWFNYWFSFTLAYSRISLEYSSLFIIVINFIFMFSLWCIDWVGSLHANRLFMYFCIKSNIGTQGEAVKVL